MLKNLRHSVLTPCIGLCDMRFLALCSSIIGLRVHESTLTQRTFNYIMVLRAQASVGAAAADVHTRMENALDRSVQVVPLFPSAVGR